MDHLDPRMEQRVWERVQLPPQEDPLPGMLAAAWQAAQLCKGLEKHYRGAETELRQAQRQLSRGAACLQGILLLKTGTKPDPFPQLPMPENPGAALRQCLNHCLKLAASCRGQEWDTQFSCIYGDLAQQASSHARLMLELIGKNI